MQTQTSASRSYTPALGPRFKLATTAYAIAYVSNELATMAGATPDEDGDYNWADARVMVSVLLDDEFGDVECGPGVDREAVVRGVEAFLAEQTGGTRAGEWAYLEEDYDL